MKKTILFLTLSLIITLSATAQLPNYLEKGGNPDGKTIIKTSITSLLLGTPSLSAERILTKNLSVVVGVSHRPTGSFPHVNKIMDKLDVDQESRDAITATKLNTFSFSPELRIYTGKGYGKGFYISPYYRYEKIGIQSFSLDVTFVDQSEKIFFEGGFNTHSAGLMIGCQWLAGKRKNIVIDWTILGGHYGISSGNFDGTYDGSIPWTEENRREAQRSIDEALEDLPIIKVKGTINEDKSANLSVDGPWAFLRGGISVGFRF